MTQFLISPYNAEMCDLKTTFTSIFILLQEMPNGCKNKATKF